MISYFPFGYFHADYWPNYYWQRYAYEPFAEVMTLTAPVYTSIKGKVEVSTEVGGPAAVTTKISKKVGTI